MSWCRVSDFDAELIPNVTIADVEAVAGVMDAHRMIFYEPAQSWTIGAPTISRVTDTRVQVDAGRYVASLDTVQAYRAGWAVADTLNVHTIDGRLISVEPLDVGNRPYAIAFTGATGVAELTDLSAGDALQVGDSVLRSGAVVMNTDADGVAQAGDVLLTPPAILRKCAINIGVRLRKLELDEDADWDGNMNTLLDGWYSILENWR